MLHSHTASVEEDQKNDNPIEHLLLHYIPDYISIKFWGIEYLIQKQILVWSLLYLIRFSQTQKFFMPSFLLALDLLNRFEDERLHDSSGSSSVSSSFSLPFPRVFNFLIFWAALRRASIMWNRWTSVVLSSARITSSANWSINIKQRKISTKFTQCSAMGIQ